MLRNQHGRAEDGTVSELNTGFRRGDQALRDVVRSCSPQTSGQVESVAIEVIHSDLERLWTATTHTPKPGCRQTCLPDDTHRAG